MLQTLTARGAAPENGMLEALDAWYSRVRVQSQPCEDNRARAQLAMAMLRTQRDGAYYSRPLAQAHDQFERQLKRGPTGRDALEGARMSLLCAIDMARSSFVE